MAFREALFVMGDLYASPLGTTVLIHSHIPPRPCEFDGVVAVVNAEHASATSVRHVLRGGRDDGTLLEVSAHAPWMEKLRLEQHSANSQGALTVWRARFASHEAAMACVAELTGPRAHELESLGGRAVEAHLWYNDTPYAERGWPTFESAVSTELLSRIAFYPHLYQRLAHDLPPKVLQRVELPAEAGGGAEWSEIGLPEEVSAAHGLERVQTIRHALSHATFSGRGDAQRVRKMYNDYIARIVRAFNAAGVLPAGSYQGECDASGRPHGTGTMLYVDGSIYRGEWNQGAREGLGTIHYETGGCYHGQFHANLLEGDGTFWHADQRVYRGGYRADHRHGVATLWDSGEVAVSRFQAGIAVGAGALWSADGEAFALHNGRPVEVLDGEHGSLLQSDLFLGESSAAPGRKLSTGLAERSGANRKLSFTSRLSAARKPSFRLSAAPKLTLSAEEAAARAARLGQEKPPMQPPPKPKPPPKPGREGTRAFSRSHSRLEGGDGGSAREQPLQQTVKEEWRASSSWARTVCCSGTSVDASFLGGVNADVTRECQSDGDEAD